MQETDCIILRCRGVILRSSLFMTVFRPFTQNPPYKQQQYLPTGHLSTRHVRAAVEYLKESWKIKGNGVVFLSSLEAVVGSLINDDW